MAFTYDPTTTRGRVRLLVGDTDTADSTKQVFSDAEIDAFLSIEGNEVYGAAAAACESLAVATARSAVSFAASRLFEIDRKDVPGHFREMAKLFRERWQQEPAEEVDSFDYQIGDFGADGSEYVGERIYE